MHRFGEGEAPDLTAYPDDPLCVEYAKRDITVDNGGAVAFLLAEPARFAIALAEVPVLAAGPLERAGLAAADTAIVRWDGSYWFDKGTGQAAARLRQLHHRGAASRREPGGRPRGAGQPGAGRLPPRPTAAAVPGWATDAGVPLDPTCAR